MNDELRESVHGQVNKALGYDERSINLHTDDEAILDWLEKEIAELREALKDYREKEAAFSALPLDHNRALREMAYVERTEAMLHAYDEVLDVAFFLAMIVGDGALGGRLSHVHLDAGARWANRQHKRNRAPLDLLPLLNMIKGARQAQAFNINARIEEQSRRTLKRLSAAGDGNWSHYMHAHGHPE